MCQHCAAHNRRRFLAGGTALAASSLAMPAIAQQRHDLVVATYGGLFEKLLREHVIPPFERDHPVNVKLELGVGSTFIPKIVASPRRSPYDVIYVNDDEALLGHAAGLWAPDQSAKLKNVKDVYDIVKPPMLPEYGCTIHEFVLVYNPAKLEKPTKWADLWRPGITVGVPHISNSYGVIFLLISALNHGGDAKNMDAGFDGLKKLANMKIFKGVTQGFTMFQQGEIDAAMFHFSRAQLLKDKGLNVAWHRPTDGSWGIRTGVQIAKMAPNLDGAVAWADMVLGVPYQTVFTTDLYSPTNRNVTVPPKVAERLVLGSDQVKTIKFVPWEILNPQRDRLLSRWTRDFTG